MTGYLGSKAASGAFQTIISLMPPHDTYIETHLGSGAVMLRKPPAVKSIGIDLDAEAVARVSLTLQQEKFQGDVELLSRCSHDFLKEYPFTGNELVYADPPYLHDTRTSNKRYRHEYTEDDHLALLDILKSLNCSVILSGYPSPLYDDALSDWNTKEYQSMTRGGVRTEKLWFNYDHDAAYWASFAGNNFTDRQRIKRKAQRWAKNYSALPPGERRAILAALMEAEVDPA